MISKDELRVRMGLKISLESLLKDIEDVILAAADKGACKATYIFPEKAEKADIDAAYMTLAKLGYTTHYGNNLYDKVTIYWNF